MYAQAALHEYAYSALPDAPARPVDRPAALVPGGFWARRGEHERSSRNPTPVAMHHPLITAQLAHDRQRALHLTAERARAVRANRRCTSSALRARMRPLHVARGQTTRRWSVDDDQVARDLIDDRCTECGFAGTALEVAEVAERLRALADHVTALPLGDGDVRRRRPDAGGWSPIEYVGHLRDAMRYHRVVIERALAEEDPGSRPSSRTSSSRRAITNTPMPTSCSTNWASTSTGWPHCSTASTTRLHKGRWWSRGPHGPSTSASSHAARSTKASTTAATSSASATQNGNQTRPARAVGA